MSHFNLVTDLSPNFGPRKDGKTARYIILHYTDSPSTETARAILKSPEREVSAHYLVSDDGTVIKMVEEEHRAWHAGKSYWRGETDMNSASIGIEIQNTGHTWGYVPFPATQLDVVKALCHGIMARWNISAANVIAHSDIAPMRKEDPGHLFPWKDFAASGIGVYTTAADMPRGDMVAAGDIRAGLLQYGYDPDAAITESIMAFQRHFEPQVFTGDGAAGTPTTRTAMILQELLSHR